MALWLQVANLQVAVLLFSNAMNRKALALSLNFKARVITWKLVRKIITVGTSWLGVGSVINLELAVSLIFFNVVSSILPLPQSTNSSSPLWSLGLTAPVMSTHIIYVAVVCPFSIGSTAVLTRSTASSTGSTG